MTLRHKDAVAVRVANWLLARGRTATGAALARTFQLNGIKTDAGGFYVVGARGIFNYLRSVWRRLDAAGMHAEAEAIARAYTDATGGYAWRE